jgi:hypothetical protein
MIGKYHKIRFFDRQKATRRLKKAKKELRAYEGGDDEERARLGRAVDEAETEVNYAQFYPLEKAYVPLFPTKKNIKGDEDGDGEGSGAKEVERVGDPEMWKRIQKCMKDGTLDALREGRLEGSRPIAAKRKDENPSSNKGAKSSRPGKVKDATTIGKVEKTTNVRNTRDEPQDEDDDSDGGFFE